MKGLIHVITMHTYSMAGFRLSSRVLPGCELILNHSSRRRGLLTNYMELISYHSNP